MDASATGGSGGQSGDGAPLDHPVGSGGDVSAVAGAAGTPAAGTGGSTRGTGGGDGARGGSAGAASGGSGAVGGRTSDAGSPDGGMAQGGAGGSVPSDGSAGGDGALIDGGAADVIFPCGPCSPHWICGGSDATEMDIILTPEEDGCYLAGLPGHVLLAPDGTVTENGVPIARAQKFGPQVGFYYPDGSQWFYCGGNLPCAR